MLNCNTLYYNKTHQTSYELEFYYFWEVSELKGAHGLLLPFLALHLWYLGLKFRVLWAPGECGIGLASHLGCCSCCCSNRLGVHGLWAEALSAGSCWAGREKEFFMTPPIILKAIGVSQGK